MFATRNSTHLALGALLALLAVQLLCAASPINQYDARDQFGANSNSDELQQFAPEHEPEFQDQFSGAARRVRRQLPQPAAPQSNPNPIAQFLNNFGPQPTGPSLMNGADTLTSLFKSLGSGGAIAGTGQQQQQQQPHQQLQQALGFQVPPFPQLPTPSAQSAGPQQAGATSPMSLLNSVTLMSQLGELMRSTQEQTARSANNAQQAAQSAGQQGLQAAQGAQGGIQSALSELGAGLTRLATNNPNLVPDVRQLYQSVSSRLSQSTGGSSLNGPIVPATNAEQLADNLAKVALQPQPNV